MNKISEQFESETGLNTSHYDHSTYIEWLEGYVENLTNLTKNLTDAVNNAAQAVKVLNLKITEQETTIMKLNIGKTGPFECNAHLDGLFLF